MAKVSRAKGLRKEVEAQLCQMVALHDEVNEWSVSGVSVDKTNCYRSHHRCHPAAKRKQKPCNRLVLGHSQSSFSATHLDHGQLVVVFIVRLRVGIPDLYPMRQQK